MSRSWRIGLTIVALLVAANLLLRLLGSLTGGTPGGPRASSYATAPRGAAAFAELLGRAGHPVVQMRSVPARTPPSPSTTVFLLDPPGVGRPDIATLTAFVRAGGRLVVSGVSGGALGGLAPNALQRTRGSDLAHVHRLRIRTDGASWRSQGFVVARSLGSGRVFLLADASPLENRLLGSADNAALGLTLAGPTTRPVEFLESYHGYGRSAGLSALPFAWKLLLGGLGLAALTWLVARGRRFGPPEPEGRALPPPRRLYVDSLAATLGRGRQRDAAIEPVRRAARQALIRRSALPPDADAAALRGAAQRLGLPADETDALLEPARTDDDVLAVGRALARIGEDRP